MLGSVCAPTLSPIAALICFFGGGVCVHMWPVGSPLCHLCDPGCNPGSTVDTVCVCVCVCVCERESPTEASIVCIHGLFEKDVWRQLYNSVHVYTHLHFSTYMCMYMYVTSVTVLLTLPYLHVFLHTVHVHTNKPAHLILLIVPQSHLHVQCMYIST